MLTENLITGRVPEVRDGSDTPISDVPFEADRLSEVARMANLLADRVLNSQIMGRSVRATDIEALLKASLLLSENGQEAPPLLDQLIQRIRAEAADTADGAR